MSSRMCPYFPPPSSTNFISVLMSWKTDLEKLLPDPHRDALSSEGSKNVLQCPFFSPEQHQYHISAGLIEIELGDLQPDPHSALL